MLVDKNNINDLVVAVASELRNMKNSFHNMCHHLNNKTAAPIVGTVESIKRFQASDNLRLITEAAEDVDQYVVRSALVFAH